MPKDAMDVRMTPEQQRQLIAAAASIENAHKLLDRAERARMDPEIVAALREKVNGAEQLRQGLLAEFSPKLTRS